SKDNTITYCHYPTAKYWIETEDKDYLERYLKTTRAPFSRLTSSSLISGSSKPSSPSASAAASATTTSSSTNMIQIKENNNNNNANVEFDRKGYLTWLKDTYDKMMRNTTVITNSRYSCKAISDGFGIEEPFVLSPPVDVDMFRKDALLPLDSAYENSKRRRTILVLCRIDPYKEIENAIDLARLLSAKNIGEGMIIAGNLDPYYADYYDSLNKMIKRYNLEDYIKIKTNAGLHDLISFMKKSQIYFHPRTKEHFGMSIVEAMSAGLVPVVPDIGGQTEFVPTKYQFHSLEQATEIISSAFDVDYSVRKNISNSVQRFSVSNYKSALQQIVAGIIE
ncbi:MAG: glycosyltransferase, partial [Thermoproteota archaeon]|nr:glycosyltransferase [Thermoproteota archaeon]